MLKIKKHRGVALIYFALTIGVILGFLMLIGNTGLLIYQKIRLQTAVDLAAYAGASVQASYLGNGSSSEDSIRAINGRIMERYQKLVEDLQFGSKVPMPMFLPDALTCAAACQAANMANAEYAKGIYQEAARDIGDYHQQIENILNQLPDASRRAAEATIAENIPELAVAETGAGAITSEVINSVQDFLRSKTDASLKKRNAVLTFATDKGLYLSNVVANVPHVFAYFGPTCFNQAFEPGTSRPTAFYCMVNGAGYPGLQPGFNNAARALALSFSKKLSGNIGTIGPLSDKNAASIRLSFVQNAHKPDPFMMVSAEWEPDSAGYMNLENSLGASGSLFPKRTKLVAVAVAEPFGSNLAHASTSVFGVRLQAIRKVLLDPRMQPVESDFPGLFDYFQTLSPRDDSGNPIETAEDTIRRFLH